MSRLLLMLFAACAAPLPLAAPVPEHAVEPTRAPVATAAPDAGVVAEADPPNDGPVTFPKIRFQPGEPIDAQLSLAAPLSATHGNHAFSISVELSSKAHGYLGKCSASIEGTTKEGAQALLSRTLTVSIVPKPHDDALLAIACEADLRRALTRHDVSDSPAIRGDLSLLVDDTTVVSGTFLVDVSGGRAAIDEGLKRLDEAREQERKDAVPSNRMPASKMPGLEAVAMQAVKNEIADTSRTEFVPLRVVITDREWTLDRNDKTGVVIRRSLSGTVAFRRADKTCFSEDVTFSEEFDGLQYQALDVDLPTRPTGDDLLCQNVWK